MTNLVPRDYGGLLRSIKDRIRAAQYAALKAVNRQLIELYWDIGRMIVERQRGRTWGKAIVERLAKDLRNEFSGARGFSASNLWRMKVFYETYTKSPKLAPLAREIAWFHNVIIMERCKDEAERTFYLMMTRRHGWSKNILIHQIENQSFQKYLANQTNFEKALPVETRVQAGLAVQDEYTFDFLGIGDEHDERELECAILSKVEAFLREMGGIFSFIGSQYRLEVGEKEYFIDLLLFHRTLKCLVALELKVGEFMPEYVGKMQFYLAALDDLVRMPDEGSSIGIILCKSKDRMIVEYALRESKKPIGVATYRVVSKLPRKYKDLMPVPERIAALIMP
ncbi:MAG: PDDEXK nuclease domain-containing protein [bacterium]